MAPTLVIHGDADAVVPLYQAKMFEKRCAEVKAPYKLIVKPGADHGWQGMDSDLEVFADWFDQHLRGIKKT
jgi:dipeptidyl aminopeptidase/acylaminoacyl peptidase